jgi:hypothetical protein
MRKNQQCSGFIGIKKPPLLALKAQFSSFRK